MSDERRGPEDTLRDGSLKATIWRRNGEHGDYFTNDFAKTYRDKDGNYQDTHSFGSGDLLGLSELARQAHHRNTELRREEFEAKREQENTPSRSQSRSR